MGPRRPLARTRTWPPVGRRHPLLLPVALLGLALLLPAPATRAALALEQVPPALVPWVGWVLANDDRRACSLTPDGGPVCTWPGRLELEIVAAGGRFTQRWRVDAPGWVPLPGDPAVWPQSVTVDGLPAPVLERDGHPAVWLDPGDYSIVGRFDWPRRPDGLTLPAGSGLLTLKLDGQAVANPRLDADGRLWLSSAGPSAAADGEPDRLALEVARRVQDGSPLLLTTRLSLDLAGKPREVRLGPVIPDGGVPLSLDSPLPARLDDAGLLILQARPGRWTLTLTSHHGGPVEQLSLGSTPPPWPTEEVWVFQADPLLRQVEVRGPAPVDPSQTRLPADWQRLPAYLLRPGDTLALVSLQRGAAAADRLRLDRELWLDFGGGGFSLRDHLTGQLQQRWRLSALPPLHLGQVRVAGEPRLITRLPADVGQTPQPAAPEPVDAPAGIEVRQGRLDLVADARLDALPTGLITTLPAAGWALDFDQADIRLQLPPGWQLLAVEGVDNLPASWLGRWSLLDLFLVLIAALAIGRLWGWPWGLLALLALVLTWPEAGAPRVVWLHVLGAAALLRVLPKVSGRAVFAMLRTLVSLYYRAALLVLAVVAVPYLISEVRTALHPQLDRGDGPFLAPAVSPDAAPAPVALARRGDLDGSADYAREKLYDLGSGVAMTAQQPLPTLDPNAQVQTGAGVPSWDWRSWQLLVNGPVGPDQALRLWLLSPALALPLALLRVGLLLLLALRLADLLRRRPSPAGGGTPAGPVTPGRDALRAPALVLLITAAGLLASVLPVRAAEGWPVVGAEAETVVPPAFPPPELLQELRERLLQPPDCLPNCASIALMRLEVDGKDLRLGLVVDAAVPLALPVPGGAEGWRPAWIGLDETSLDALRRSPDGPLQVPVPAGRHAVLLSGPLPAAGEVQLPLPLRPRLMSVDLPPGWRLDGVAANGQPGEQLRLVREQAAAPADPSAPADATPVAFPPLLKVTRTLTLGFDWTLTTEVQRLSPAGVAVSVPVPLWAGEAVTTPDRQIKDGAMLVALPVGRTRDGWSATLTPQAELALTAGSDPRITEEWRLQASPLWHVTIGGIPPLQPVGTEDAGVVVWRPFAGETVTLAVVRPEAVPGPTLTLDQARYVIRPGRRGSESTLRLLLRSSQGGRHRIGLPGAAELTLLRVDGQPRPLVLQGGVLDLPLVPGNQAVEVGWRTTATSELRFRPAPVDLGSRGVNLTVAVQPAADRWVLWVSGPPDRATLGPAVVFWSLLAVLALLALAFARLGLTPLGFWDWLLLGVGLSQAGIWSAALVTLWLFALGLRRRLAADTPRWRFNLAQVGLVVLSLAALAALVAAVEQGLLGAPAMQIAGNGSTADNLQWYLDRGGPLTPTVTVWSVPVWVYRALMLAWALWLAFRLLGWLRWGWQGFSEPTLWRERPPAPPRGPRATTEEPLSVDL